MCIRLLETEFPFTLVGCIALLKSQSRCESKDIVPIITVPSILHWVYHLCTHVSVDDIL
ncbi:hypothetical protein EST38_g5906 [Candolleomyces aberdarensis]|uniref:Uncharacterized protein n=1 Tax=Candolleomyces aberdarensis TaxID=2316362 RepID=A0A4Q2DMJ4_9AGAR|nr:hypothetical protein EST38_g5906 [Candolleomyces aberdarensis]